MKHLLVITGGNRGLGKSIVDLFIDKTNYNILLLSRKIHQSHMGNGKINFLEIDLSGELSEKKINKITNQTIDYSKIIFINNAFTIEPIIKLKDFTISQINHSFNTNMKSSISIISRIIKTNINKELVFVNISSGASYKAIDCWSLYCSAKAYMNMFFDSINIEYKSKNIKSINFDPGVMDTDMQKIIRESNFENVDHFLSLSNKNQLKSPSEVSELLFKKII
tara:strand:+ start:25571 stop:26239 length:669 start_codon:yes stop_codon:yes gene_type:complete